MSRFARAVAAPALLLLGLGLPRTAGAVVSVGEVLTSVAQAVTQIEAEGVQVVDCSVGFITRQDPVYQFPIQLTQGQDTMLVGVGDSSRILDLDIVVLDQRGKEITRDVLTDNMPIVTVKPTYTGTYMVQMKAASLAQGVNDGFFGFIRAAPTSSVISVADTILTAAMLSANVEGQSFQVETVQVTPVTHGSPLSTTVDLTGGHNYMLAGIGSPSRIADLDMSVTAPDGTLVGSDTQTDNAPVVAVLGSQQATYTVVLTAHTMLNGAPDGHALLMVARHAQ